MESKRDTLLARPPAGCRAVRREEFRAGDVVTHRYDDWGGDTCVIETVDGVTFPKDPVAFFVGGGFWRTSRLKLVAHAPSSYECPCCAAIFEADQAGEVTCPECGAMFRTGVDDVEE